MRKYDDAAFFSVPSYFTTVRPANCFVHPSLLWHVMTNRSKIRLISRYKLISISILSSMKACIIMIKVYGSLFKVAFKFKTPTPFHEKTKFFKSLIEQNKNLWNNCEIENSNAIFKKFLATLWFGLGLIMSDMKFIMITIILLFLGKCIS